MKKLLCLAQEGADACDFTLQVDTEGGVQPCGLFKRKSTSGMRMSVNKNGFHIPVRLCCNTFGLLAFPLLAGPCVSTACLWLCGGPGRSRLSWPRLCSPPAQGSHPRVFPGARVAELGGSSLPLAPCGAWLPGACGTPHSRILPPGWVAALGATPRMAESAFYRLAGRATSREGGSQTHEPHTHFSLGFTFN